MRQVEPTDAAFLYLESENTHAHGTFVWFYQPHPDSNTDVSFRDIYEHIGSRLDVADVFRQKLAKVPFDLDYPYWVTDQDFAQDYHVRCTDIPKPGGWRELFGAVSRIHSNPLAMDRPLWEIHVLQGLGDIEGLPEGTFVLLAKFHHVAIDGATGMSIIEGLHDTKPGGSTTASRGISEAPLDEKPALPVLLALAGLNNIRYAIMGLQLATEFLRRLPKILSVVRLSTLFEGKQAPETIFNQDISSERVIDCIFFKLEEIKRLRRKVPGATVNDVLLSICGGALRRLLESRDSLPDQSMVVACPINVRTESETESGGNRITTMFTRVHTELADPVERLKAVNRSSRKAKRIIEAIGARNLMELSNCLPSPVLALAASAMGKISDLVKGPSIFNCPVSNLPGPRKPLYLAGARLLHIGCGMPVMDGYGLFLGICTYDESLSFTITSSKNILPDPGQLTMHIEHAFNELKNAAGHPETTQRVNRQKNTSTSSGE